MWVAFNCPRAIRLGPVLAGVILGAALGLGAGRAQACAPRIAQAPQDVRIDYDPFALAAAPGRLDLELANDGDEACTLELRFVDIGGQPLRALDLGGVGVGFRIREGTGPAIAVIEPHHFRLELAPGAQVEAVFDAVVLADAVAEAGEHSAGFRIEIGEPGRAAALQSDQLTLTLASPPRAQVNIAGAAGAFGSSGSVEVIDFGEAATGAVKRTFVQVRANTGSRLSFQSANGGVMRRIDGIPTDPAIAYEAILEGEALDLRRGDIRAIDPPRTLAGQSLSLDLRLGPVGSQMSGRYEDLLTIDIDPD